MAFLSSYLSSPTRSTNYGAPSVYSRRSSPYTPLARRRTRSIQPPQTPDIASALLAQKQMGQAAVPPTRFETAWDYDPIMQKIQALASQTVANAETDASAARRDAFIGAGDPTLAASLGADASTIEAARQNPMGQLALLQKEFLRKSQETEEGRNAQNLFYSGTYAQDLQDLARSKGEAEAGVGRSLRELLAGADTGVLAARENQRKTQEQEARDKAMQLMLSGDIEGGQGILNALGKSQAAYAGRPDLQDFMYGNVVAGYSDEDLFAAAKASAPEGGTAIPIHVMHNGEVTYVNGVPGIFVKFKQSDGLNTIWIPLPPSEVDKAKAAAAQQAAAGPDYSGIQATPQGGAGTSIQSQLSARGPAFDPNWLTQGSVNSALSGYRAY